MNVAGAEISRVEAEVTDNGLPGGLFIESSHPRWNCNNCSGRSGSITNIGVPVAVMCSGRSDAFNKNRAISIGISGLFIDSRDIFGFSSNLFWDSRNVFSRAAIFLAATVAGLAAAGMVLTEAVFVVALGIVLATAMKCPKWQQPYLLG